MTHISNIPHIIKYGITHRQSANFNENYRPIGDASVISARCERHVTTVTGQEFVPGDFIPFYFYVRMPMLYNIQHGYKVKQTSPEDIVYLIVDMKPIIENPERIYYFSDRHALNNRAKFYGRESIAAIDSLLDREAIRASEWGNDYWTKERKQAEFLVKGDIPADYICGICCYSDVARRRLVEIGVTCALYVRPDAYYPFS